MAETDKIAKEVKKAKAGKIERKRMSRAATIAVAIAGIGAVAGATVVIGLYGIMKKIFVNESWPDEEWSSDDWAGEDLEN